MKVMPRVFLQYPIARLATTYEHNFQELSPCSILLSCDDLSCINQRGKHEECSLLPPYKRVAFLLLGDFFTESRLCDGISQGPFQHRKCVCFRFLSYPFLLAEIKHDEKADKGHDELGKQIAPAPFQFGHDHLLSHSCTALGFRETDQFPFLLNIASKFQRFDFSQRPPQSPRNGRPISRLSPRRCRIISLLFRRRGPVSPPYPISNLL